MVSKTRTSRGASSARRPSKPAKRDALLRQQRALAQFGELALKTHDLDAILQEACRLVGEALGTDLAKIITCEDGGGTLLVRTGVGWRPGVVGRRLTPQDDSADRFALQSAEPVIAATPEDEKRFKVADFLLEEGVQAFVNVPIIGGDHRPPIGILEVDSRSPRQFTRDDISFLRTYANMIAAAAERQRNIKELREVAEQRAQLLQELQHRLKNNLQSVSSFIGIALNQAETPAAKEILQSLSGRIDALRLVHEKLYASGKFDRVELASYLGELAASLLRFHRTDDEEIGFKSDLRPLTVPTDLAIPLGLIVTEFITNSVKHAFDGGGTISIRLDSPRDGEGRIVLADNGHGLGNGPSPGTGLRLIAGLARQVGGEARWRTERGTELTITFPIVREGAPVPPFHAHGPR
jgi:two-component sensor histidine kinase